METEKEALLESVAVFSRPKTREVQKTNVPIWGRKVILLGIHYESGKPLIEKPS